MNAYNNIDMDNEYKRGWWAGILIGSISALVTCLLAGLFL